jgi:hypothetical protein
LAPAPSTKKPAPHDSNPAMAGPNPQAMEALCLYAEPSSRASNPPSLKGYNLAPLVHFESWSWEEKPQPIFHLQHFNIATDGIE